MLCLIKQFETQKEYTELRRHDVTIFKGMVSSVIGRKLEKLICVVLFMDQNIVQALFHLAGTDPDSQTALISQ